MSLNVYAFYAIPHFSSILMKSVLSNGKLTHAGHCYPYRGLQLSSSRRKIQKTKGISTFYKRRQKNVREVLQKHSIFIILMLTGATCCSVSSLRPLIPKKIVENFEKNRFFAFLHSYMFEICLHASPISLVFTGKIYHVTVVLSNIWSTSKGIPVWQNPAKIVKKMILYAFPFFKSLKLLTDSMDSIQILYTIYSSQTSICAELICT